MKNINTEFFSCGDCKSVLLKIPGTVPNVPEGIVPLNSGVIEASHEKHIPVVMQNSQVVSVSVGSVAHPMIPEHYILWILLQTDMGYHIKTLSPGQDANVQFMLSPNEKPLIAYAMCNIHGLWKTEI